MTTGKFSKSNIDTLARRAGYLCSNPDCRSITAGPAKDEEGSVIIGEAAHIYGARHGSARFDPEMSDSTRSEIVNSIWLCRNCHKVVDANEVHYSASLLFEWRRSHEVFVAERQGKPGAILRQKALNRALDAFRDRSYLEQQIIIDKPDAWELKLTIEALRSSLEPIRRRWFELEQGLYALQYKFVAQSDFHSWFQAHLDGLDDQAEALNRLISRELVAAWGPYGQEGFEDQILRVVDLIGEACRRLLQWEESVRFTRVPEELQELQGLLSGVAGPWICKILDLYSFYSGIISSGDTTSTHRLRIELKFPEGWSQTFREATIRNLARRNSDLSE